MWLCSAHTCALLCLLTVTPRILRAMAERQSEFTHFRRIRIAMGTWNVNGGKQFRSNLLGTAELADWLLDSPKLSGLAGSPGECVQLSRPRGPRFDLFRSRCLLRIGIWCSHSRERLESAVV